MPGWLDDIQQQPQLAKAIWDLMQSVKAEVKAWGGHGRQRKRGLSNSHTNLKLDDSDQASRPKTRLKCRAKGWGLSECESEGNATGCPNELATKALCHNKQLRAPSNDSLRFVWRWVSEVKYCYVY